MTAQARARKARQPARTGALTVRRKSPARTADAKRRARLTARRRWVSTFNAAPKMLKIAAGLLVALALTLAVNWIYQVARKPSELLFPVSGTLFKVPADTWRSYAPLFRRHATHSITPELLAALAQAEGAGNPVARTYWRWAWKPKPFEIYRPASSSVGMYQMTDGTFAEARQYCVKNHGVVQEGAWNDWQSCWLNGLYLRVLPGHAIELTAAYLDVHVANILARQRVTSATLLEKQHLAAVIHLCGAGAGDLYVRHGFHFAAGQRCGEHDPRAYLARVDSYRAEFHRLAQRE